MGPATLTYDAENRQLRDSDSVTGGVVVYGYDGLGQRVSKTVNGVATLYVHDVFGDLASEYNSQAAAQCATCYLSWDGVGSTRLVTDQNGSVKATHDYLPFGVEIPGGLGGRNGTDGAADGLTAKFTGQDHDTETNLEFFEARYLSAGPGRFMNPDPAVNFVADPRNPQSWNLYSYSCSQASCFSQHNKCWQRGANLFKQMRERAPALRLHSSYPDRTAGRETAYEVQHLPMGMTLMYGAGLISALLGIGSGVLKIPAMDTALRLPIKVSSATSNFMIGVTAAASAGAYLMRGDVVTALAGPVALGSLAGAVLGAHILMVTPNEKLRVLFVIVLVALGIQMLSTAFGVHLSGSR